MGGRFWLLVQWAQMSAQRTVLPKFPLVPRLSIFEVTSRSEMMPKIFRSLDIALSSMGRFDFCASFGDFSDLTGLQSRKRSEVQGHGQLRRWYPVTSTGCLSVRRVRDFGGGWDFRSQDVSETLPLRRMLLSSKESTEV